MLNTVWSSWTAKILYVTPFYPTLPGTRLGKWPMLNKNTGSGVGDPSPQVGSSCLAAPEHQTGDEHPGRGSRLEPLRVQLITLNQGWRHQGKRKEAKWWASCNWLRKEKGKHSQLGKVSGELPLSFQELVLWHSTARGFMGVPGPISPCWSLNTLQGWWPFFSVLAIQVWCRDVLLLCFLLYTSHSFLPECYG